MSRCAHGRSTRLHLADDSFFKIKPALAPAENLSDGGFAFERSKDRMPHRAMVQVNLAVSPARFEGKPAAALAQAAHLQNLGRGKLVEIADERMAGIDPLRRRSALRRANAQSAAIARRKPPLAAIASLIRMIFCCCAR